MLPGQRRGAILSLVAHAICTCHFSPTMRRQDKGPRGRYGSSCPPAWAWRETCSRLSAPVANLFFDWLNRLKKTPKP